jgi:CheY-like chemotaxis protein
MVTVLTVEDEEAVSEYLSEVLREAGHHVIATSNADDAIKVLEARADIRVIMTDINMPGSMDGLKLAAAVRDKWPPIKIIITTGRGRPPADQMPKGSAFIPKPYDAAALRALVARLN